MIHVSGMPRKLKDFYQHLGLLRDLQLQEQYIKPDAFRLPIYSKILHRQVEQSKQELARYLSKKMLAKARKKTMAKVKSNFSHKTYQKYLQSKTMAMQHMLQARSFSDNDLHAIRKSLKELSNNQQLNNSAIQDKLGEFQDARNALHLLRKYWPADLSNKEAGLLKYKEQVLLRQKKRMKAQLAQEIKTIS